MTGQQEYASIPGLLASYSGPLGVIVFGVVTVWICKSKQTLSYSTCFLFFFIMLMKDGMSLLVFLLYTIAVNAVYGLVEALMGNFDVGVSLIQLLPLITGLRRRIYKEFV